MISLPYSTKKILQSYWFLIVVFIASALFFTLSESEHIEITEEEEKWIDEHPTITFAGRDDLSPFADFNKQDKFEGVVNEGLQLVEESSNIDIEVQKVINFADLIDSDKKSQFDLFPQSAYALDKENFVLTKHYLSTPLVIVTREKQNFIGGLDLLNGQKVAILKNHQLINDIKAEYPLLNLIEVRSTKSGMIRLSEGKYDAFLSLKIPINYHIQETGFSNLEILDDSTEFVFNLRYAVKKNNPELLSIINKSIDNFSKEQRNEVKATWGKNRFVPPTDYRMLLDVVLGSVICLAFIFWWNIYLKKQVKLREAEVEKRKTSEKKLVDTNLALKKAQKQAEKAQKIAESAQKRAEQSQKIAESAQKRAEQSQKIAESAQEQANKANQAKTDFLSNVSHEIRTPLNVIMGYTQLLGGQIQDNRQKNILKTVNSAGQDLLVLINDVLDISKIEEGKLNISVSSCNFHRLITDIGNIFTLSLQERNLEFKLIIDPEIPSTLFLDQTRMRQVLVNLIGNAIKFTHSGHVSMRAHLTNLNLHESQVDISIDVEDTGIGIAKADLDKVFDKFEQVTTKSNRTYEGSGLGLAISKRLVAGMGGELTVKSQPKIGSTFTMSLPNINIACIAVDDIPNNALFDINNIHFKTATILVVDDVKENRQLIKDVFEGSNIEVHTTNNGQKAVDMVKEQDFDLIFMDTYMPELNGYQATKMIKSLKDIPVVVLTASLMSEYDLDEREIFDSSLTKPVLISDLYCEIMKYLPYEDTNNTGKNEMEALSTSQPSISISQYVQEKSYVQEVIKKLSSMQKTCNTLLANNSINGVKTFIEQINTIMAEYPTQAVQKYVDELSDNVENVNIMAWRKGLQAFDKLIMDLEA